MDRNEAAIYLAGLIDGEGYIPKFNFSKKLKSGYKIRISNSDENIIKKLVKCLETLDIGYYIYTQKYENFYKDVHIIHITGRKKFIKLLTSVAPFMGSDEKVKNLYVLVNNIRPKKQ